MKSVLVTGVGGFCGRHLASRLSRHGSLKVLGTGRGPKAPSGVAVDEYVQGDICEPQQVADLIRRLSPDAVFHLAGTSSGEALDVYRTNLLGTLHLLEATRRFACNARVLLVGSAAEYGPVDPADLPVCESHSCRPRGPYGLSKYAATLAGLDYARRFGMRIVVARPFNIVGAGVPDFLVVGAILKRIKQALRAAASVIEVGDVDGQRDFVAVEDVVDGYVRMVGGDHWGEVFNLCTGQPHSVRSVVSMLLSYSPRPLELRVDPTLGASRGADVYGSVEKSRKLLGFAPSVRLEQSLREAWDHEFAEPDEIDGEAGRANPLGL